VPGNETSEAINDTVKRIYRNLETLKALDNGCCLLAMRELLDDPYWAPEEIVDAIVTNNGLPSTNMILLEKYAPVKVIQKGQLRMVDGGGEVIISIEDEPSIVLQGKERVAISYTTNAEAKRGHMECINIGDVDKECLVLIIKRVLTGD